MLVKDGIVVQININDPGKFKKIAPELFLCSYKDSYTL
jgi:hypothetical protein